MNDTEFYIDPTRGVVCSRAGHLIAEQVASNHAACPYCGKVLCPKCISEGVRLTWRMRASPLSIRLRGHYRMAGTIIRLWALRTWRPTSARQTRPYVLKYATNPWLSLSARSIAAAIFNGRRIPRAACRGRSEKPPRRRRHWQTQNARPPSRSATVPIPEPPPTPGCVPAGATP